MQPLEQRFVLLPGGELTNWRFAGDVFQRGALHLQIGPRVDLRRIDVDMTEEVANDLQRHAAL